ncbi:hypothetical protein HLRTI_002945 [Halorhabdus tiamatea SARL4B]|uniref:Hypothetical membrane protein n=1 Tax=Halorhabdus tiamatea SARL4B TaxID=1033806 RepID=F7PNC2_9EURY|nr:hypothetical protein [Halorhabdus tiamatea]ERJ05073.1 hypothetical protein HLRTI_002945 [Halorhabdus tiamatea SARL4B]CCQ34596.1 hypothetical membrane protein [Halorhabdus tiamatea SARL4B]
MALRDVDRRAVGIAALLAAAISFVHVSTSTGTITAATTNTLVMAVGIAAVPAGVVVGVWSGSYDRHLIEGGFAAAGGTAIGILGWSVVKAALLDGVPIAHRLDVIFLVVALEGPVFAVVAPFLFLVGGYTAARVADWTDQSIDDQLTIGLFR